MKLSELKQIIRECIDEVSINEGVRTKIHGTPKHHAKFDNDMGARDIDMDSHDGTGFGVEHYNAADGNFIKGWAKKHGLKTSRVNPTRKGVAKRKRERQASER